MYLGMDLHASRRANWYRDTVPVAAVTSETTCGLGSVPSIETRLSQLRGRYS